VQAEFRKTFFKDFDKLPKQIKEIIVMSLEQNISSASNILDIKQIKKLRGHKSYYRYKVHDDYRIGLRLEENIVIIDRVLHRGKIYKVYPPK
jgi:mRNA-degrading endonuclease RelE of RelBE toxin-antitoxin system